MTKRAKACSRKPTPSAIRTGPTTRRAAGALSDRQPVRSQGISPATTPGASTRNAALPAATNALRDRCPFSGKALDQLGEALGLVLRDECVGVLDPLQRRSLDRRDELLGEGDLEEAVLDGPCQQGRAVEVPELVGRLDRVPRLDAPQDLDGVAADLAIGEEGADPLAGRRAGEVVLDQAAVGIGEAPQRGEAHA